MTLEQEDIHARFMALGQGAWTTVYENWRSEDSNGGIYCAFAPPSKRPLVVSEPGWNITKGDFRPGFSQYHEGGEWKTTYFPGSMAGDFEPLILVREYYGVVPSTLEVAEQFRLYHNLYWDELTSQFMQPHDDGTSSIAIKLDGNRKVEVRTKLLRQYQAARQLDMLLFVDSVRFGVENEKSPKQQDWASEVLRATRFADNGLVGRVFTRYLGTRVLPSPPIEKAGIWPYEEVDDYYPEFIIGVDEVGDDIRYTCNPDALANYFGANPDAPNYLTPVHFRREVLQKYYEQPELYTVADGNLTCASLWSLRLDNSAETSVVVFLGDLGRDLPKQERDHWRSYNVTPDSSASETFIRRAFLGQFVEPSARDLQVRSRYISLRRSWHESYGWHLFRKPEEADAGLLQRLRLPLNESQAEFEASIRILTQLMVDAINEAKIEELLTNTIANEKGISKLRRWLEQEGYPYVERDIKFLRNLQEVRSKATAHRKGSDYEKVLERIFGHLRGPAAIKTLFDAALTMLTELEEWATRNSADK